MAALSGIMVSGPTGETSKRNVPSEVEQLGSVVKEMRELDAQQGWQRSRQMRARLEALFSVKLNLESSLIAKGIPVESTPPVRTWTPPPAKGELATLYKQLQEVPGRMAALRQADPSLGALTRDHLKQWYGIQLSLEGRIADLLHPPPGFFEDLVHPRPGFQIESAFEHAVAAATPCLVGGPDTALICGFVGFFVGSSRAAPDDE